MLRWTRRACVAVTLANAAALGLVGCGGEAAPPSNDIDDVFATDVHPDAMPADGAGSALTEAERTLLARAKGREWSTWSGRDVDAYLSPGGDTARVLLLWDPRQDPGAAALLELTEAIGPLGEEGAELAVAVRAGGDERSELIALRESQIALTAVRIPTVGHLAADRRGTVALYVDGELAEPTELTIE